MKNEQQIREMIASQRKHRDELWVKVREHQAVLEDLNPGPITPEVRGRMISAKVELDKTLVDIVWSNAVLAALGEVLE